MLNTFLTLEQLIEQEQMITGEQAIRLSGMQDSLIEQIAKQNLYFGSMTSFIVSDINNYPPFNAPGVPKPPNIHSKTSSFVAGYIPVDPVFTRPGIDGKPLGHHYGDNLENQETIQVSWTLWEILKRCGTKGDLDMNWPNDGCSVVRFAFKQGRGPSGFSGCFQLDLGEERKKDCTNRNEIRVVTREWDDPQKYLVLIPDKILEALGESREQVICNPYKIFYNSEKNGLFKPLMVFASGGRPIIGDLDKDLESLPMNIGILDLKTANTEYNTFILNTDSSGISEQIKLIDATKKLFMNLLYKDSVFQSEFNECFALGLDPDSTTLIYDAENLFYTIAIKTTLLARAGVITPYEFLRNILANHAHNSCNISKGIEGYFNDPFQHGVDLRSPFSLDNTISHSYDGGRFHIFAAGKNKVQYIYTRNQEQRIKLYLIFGFLETNFIHVSPIMDMEKWHIIIEKQIELKQQELIHPATMLAYKKYKKSTQLQQTEPKTLLGINVWPLGTGKKIRRQSSDASSVSGSPASTGSATKKHNKIVETFLKLKSSLFSGSGSTRTAEKNDQQSSNPDLSSPLNTGVAPFRSMDAAVSSATLNIARDIISTVGGHMRGSPLLRYEQDRRDYEMDFIALPNDDAKSDKETDQMQQLLEQPDESSDLGIAQIPASLSSSSVLAGKSKSPSGTSNIRSSIVCVDGQIKLQAQDPDEQQDDDYTLKPMGPVLERLKLAP